jgi:hypothetical protein
MKILCYFLLLSVIAQNVTYILKASLSILLNLVKIPENVELYHQCNLKEVSLRF